MHAAWTSPCAHGRPHARSAGVPCARRAEDVAPYQPAHPGPPPGRHGRMAVTGTFVVGADVPGGPRPPGRPRARGMDVPVRTACASPCARRAEDVAPYQPTHSGPPPGAARAHGGHGDICGRGRRPRRPASPGASPCARHGRPRAHSVRVPLRAARRGRRALPAAHPVPLCRETLCPPPGRCGHERTAARCAILFGLRGTDECGRVPVRGVHHGTAKRRKPKRPCV